MEDNLRVFVYGSLKRGFSNWEQFCAGYEAVRPAEVRGKLFQFPTAGFPIADIPEEDILLEGTRNPWHDMEKQIELQHKLNHGELSFEMTSSECCSISGDLYEFRDPETRLPELDWLEGFRAGKRSYYKRVLAPAFSEKGVELAWLYIKGHDAEGLLHIPEGDWTGPA
ncbi:MAG: gamma-glutamylcyclotransferase family protein [Planctomycetota bacterium]|nr:gamma-glutamylcyclotransferase family protein [Planctomycetota bacterium]